ncbi:MAG: hypothetical protein E6H40_13805 [Betaproteobacteria bacterium]|nr:MAG: hypothetical protein E6H40_13805 [Betaproteobacteria bacterium]
MSLARRAMAEGLGTALLLAAVVGSGIMGERLSQGNDALTLLANSLATGFALSALIVAFGPRSGAHWWSEVVASFGLVLIVLSCDRPRPWAAPLAVAAYITAAYWFTASTSFANPAVTLARGFTNTFTGIDLMHTGPFIAAQLVGAALALLADRLR